MEALVGIPANQALRQLQDAESGATFANFNALEHSGETARFYAGKNVVKEVSIYNKAFQNFLMKKENYPADYVHTLGTTLERDIIHHHIDNLDPFRLNPGNKMVIRTDEAEDFRVVSYLNKIVKPSEVFQMHLDMVPGKEKTVAHFSMGNSGVRYSILSDAWNVSFLDGHDVSFFGLTGNWNDSFVSPKIFGSAHRPSCANLLNHHRNIGRINAEFKNFNKFEVLKRFKSAGMKAIDYVNNHLIPNLGKTTSISYQSGMEVLMALVGKYSFSDEARIAIRVALEAEPGDTLYHLIQACTRASTHSITKLDDVVLINRLLKSLMSSVEEADHTCVACGH